MPGRSRAMNRHLRGPRLYCQLRTPAVGGPPGLRQNRLVRQQHGLCDTAPQLSSVPASAAGPRPGIPYVSGIGLHEHVGPNSTAVAGLGGHRRARQHRGHLAECTARPYTAPSRALKRDGLFCLPAPAYFPAVLAMPSLEDPTYICWALFGVFSPKYTSLSLASSVYIHWKMVSLPPAVPARLLSTFPPAHIYTMSQPHHAHLHLLNHREEEYSTAPWIARVPIPPSFLVPVSHLGVAYMNISLDRRSLLLESGLPLELRASLSRATAA
ncbi:hypothetical protein GGTG_10007 [Gaeumannomyces tritici R3-111a-1]|uniref:Uncharacterized protein n=1 Tax=Gaeumannomyces tritici (strain R3-111a-1) TaxID=644352 RepID=J3P923_GAET3|nr:hypothetical protein GGTG_10007 [Gaeumannomyces tritici R3-111a-1]EJT73158.1 hypothetical protein GGTG_10007 [Gaeumannomyces tritici R3-111a-1]